MKLLFIGGSFPKNQEDDIYRCTKGLYDFAANILQRKIIFGLREKLKNDFYYVSTPFINPFPNGYKKIYYKGMKESDYEIYCNFFNVWGIRNISRFFHTYNNAKNFLNVKDKEKYIIVYSPHVPFLKTAVDLKNKDNNIKIILLLPDLPQFISLSNTQKIIYKFLKKFDIYQFYKLSNEFDSYILLTKYMNEFVNKNFEKKYMILEGIANDNYLKNFTNCKKNNNKLFNITYTGTLHEVFGIKKFVDSFMKDNNENYVLNICGTGDSAEYIEKCSKIDSRIKYYGQVSNDKALSIQRNSDVLVNPRTNSGKFTKYSFPSKTLEYLSSGVIVVAYKLDGIPDEYDDILFYPDNNSDDSIMQKINEIYNMSDIKKAMHLEKTANFLKNKSINYSIERIINFIRSL